MLKRTIWLLPFCTVTFRRNATIGVRVGFAAKTKIA